MKYFLIFFKNIFLDRKAFLCALPMLVGSSVANRPIKLSVEAEALASLVRALSAISLMFIIMVTPWAILQVMMKKFTSRIGLKALIVCIHIFT